MAKQRDHDVDQPTEPTAGPAPPRPEVGADIEDFELSLDDRPPDPVAEGPPAGVAMEAMAIEELPSAAAPPEDEIISVDLSGLGVVEAQPPAELEWVSVLKVRKQHWPLPNDLAKSFAKAKDAIKQKYLIGRPGAMVHAISSHPHHNIVGIGVGRKWIGGFPTGTPALIILVRRKFAEGDLVEAHRLPREIGGVATDVIETGRFHLLANPRTRWRPYQPGCSIGPENLPGPVPLAGTLGAIVRDRATQQLHLLSAAHVLTNFGAISKAQAQVFQPSLLDYGTVNDLVGQLERYKLWTQQDDVTLDAGITTLLQPNGATNDIPVIGQVAGIAPMEIDDSVEKFGRTTRHSEGDVIATGIDDILPEGSPRRFFGQVLIRGTQMGPFADFGDSGSLVVAAEKATLGTKPAAGLLVAGNSESRHGHFAVATPIQPIMDALAVDMA
jgi:hypothetical protein